MSGLGDADVLVVGAGETGVAVASHLALAGVGRIGFVDPEHAEAAAGVVNAISREVLAEAYPTSIEDAPGVLTVDRTCVVEATGDGGTRALVQDACAKNEVPCLAVAPGSDPAAALRTAADVVEASL